MVAIISFILLLGNFALMLFNLREKWQHRHPAPDIAPDVAALNDIAAAIRELGQ